jgi:hypothetical protein
VRYSLLALSLALLASCVHTQTARCLIKDDELEALSRMLAARDWLGLTPETLALTWPNPARWGERTASKEICDGSVLMARLGYVISDDCYCCETFLYAQRKTGSGECRESLESITIVRTVLNRQQAGDLAARLSRAAGMPSGLPESEHVASDVREIAPQVSETVRISIVQVGSQWIVRMVIFRVTLPTL